MSLPIGATAQQEPLALSNPVNAYYLLKLALALVLVLIIIVVLARVARGMPGVAQGSRGVLAILGQLSVGSRERIVLVQAGPTQLLLGVSSAGVVKLHEFDQAIVKADDAAASQSFKARLDQIMTPRAVANSADDKVGPGT